MSKQQIPPLRCGMTNKEQVQQQRPTAIATTTADSSASLRNDKQKGKGKGKNNCYAHEVSISQLYVD
jgi:hypothetical protein